MQVFAGMCAGLRLMCVCFVTWGTIQVWLSPASRLTQLSRSPPALWPAGCIAPHRSDASSSSCSSGRCTLWSYLQCRDGGDLMCCDGCPSAYHPDCVGFSAVPNESWFCPACVQVRINSAAGSPPMRGGLSCLEG